MPSHNSIGTGAEAELPEYAGHYRLEERLGAGGMGVVHLARSAAGLPLAVKVVHAEFAEDPEFRGRFRQEVAAARRVSGAFTAPVVDADPEAELPWMATLFIPGPTLAEYVKRNGPLAPAQLRHLTAGLAEALRDIHRAGVVHRDLKPSNVLLAEDSPKVIDFGISRPKDSELRTETGKLIGTPPFMAPEQFRRPREVGPAADVFALGSLLVHAATGRGPFDSDSPYLVAYQVVHDEPDVSGVPDDLAPLVLGCLAKEPEERPTPDELMARLRHISARYDTQAFIPAQRAPVEPSTDPTDFTDSIDNSPEEASSSPTPQRRPRPRTLVTLAGVLALSGALTVPLLWGSDPGSGTGTRTAPAGSPATFHPWQRALGPGAAPVCSYGAGSLNCAVPGALAVSLDPRDGSVRWKRKASGAAGDVGGAAPVVSGGLVHALTPDGSRLVAMAADTGRTRWSMDVSRFQGQVRQAAGRVLLAAPDGTLSAVDSATGRREWHRRLPGASTTPPTLSYVGGDLAYAATPTPDGTNTLVSAVDPATGDVRWQQRSPGTATPLGVSGGAVWCTQRGPSGETVALVGHRLTDGAVARRVRLSLPLPSATAALHGGTVYLLAAGGALVAQDLASGKQVWRSETSVSRGSAPAVDAASDRVYVSAPDGRLLAVDRRTGRPVGQSGPRPAGRSDRVVADIPAPVVSGGRVYGSAPDGTVSGAATADGP
ncbi:serine/threonine-protein kinase [Streptomyces endophyticus]|uniref:PQQ-binding-like beta-propeller repeat protein n=1 Tax=Streptomyces endophyticus TaxID=714166 RepID=A0ABU6FAJ3_9ACTN|nr:serine/threonine-protein kinase [Streptomyces endophyticus]MEB8341065.1 PQQ-binding-like beta-propeller repeat protein [Streptomyces endophyticus]